MRFNERAKEFVGWIGCEIHSRWYRQNFVNVVTIKFNFLVHMSAFPVLAALKVLWLRTRAMGSIKSVWNSMLLSNNWPFVCYWKQLCLFYFYARFQWEKQRHGECISSIPFVDRFKMQLTQSYISKNFFNHVRKKSRFSFFLFGSFWFSVPLIILYTHVSSWLRWRRDSIRASIPWVGHFIYLSLIPYENNGIS